MCTRPDVSRPPNLGVARAPRMRLVKPGLILALLVALLTGCATNMASVNTFGKATQGLATQTSTVLGRYTTACRDRLALLLWEQDVVDHAARYWKSSPGGNDAAKARASLQKLETIAAQLARSIPLYQQQCPIQEEMLGVLPTLSTVLENYAAAIQLLANDQFVTYNGQLNALPEALAKFKASPSGRGLLDGPQEDAITKLAGAIYEMATRSYRQRELKRALSPPIRQQLRTLAVTLDALADSYKQSLVMEDTQQHLVANTIADLLANQVLPEPLAVSELNRQIKTTRAALAERTRALDAYKVAISEMDVAFGEAADSMAHPDNSAIAQGVIRFAQSAYNAEKAIAHAF